MLLVAASSSRKVSRNLTVSLLPSSSLSLSLDISDEITSVSENRGTTVVSEEKLQYLASESVLLLHRRHSGNAK